MNIASDVSTGIWNSIHIKLIYDVLQHKTLNHGEMTGNTLEFERHTPQSLQRDLKFNGNYFNTCNGPLSIDEFHQSLNITRRATWSHSRLWLGARIRSQRILDISQFDNQIVQICEWCNKTFFYKLCFFFDKLHFLLNFLLLRHAF